MVKMQLNNFWVSHAEFKRKYQRKRKDCPVPGCNSHQLVKLADHLHYVHRIKDKTTRQKWLNKAKQVTVQVSEVA